MDIVALGINHRTAPVEVREKLAFSEKQIGQALQSMAGSGAVAECVILSTCNRTEVYALAADAAQGKEAILALLAAEKGLYSAIPEESLYCRGGREAVAHLFRVAAGLDSMVLGETQILGQVREAYETAARCGSVGKVLHTLFRQALVCGKRVHTETKINESAASVSYAAVKLAGGIFERLDRRSILVLGAGKMSELTLKHLHAKGAGEIVIINRTRERAEALARAFAGRICGYDSLEECLERADIVISSTGAPHFIIQKPVIARIMRLRRNRPLFLIDIAVPRDVDPAVNDLDNVYLYDIDDLQAVVAANMKEREKEARLAEAIADEEAAGFLIWFKTLNVVPLITALRQKAESIREEELRKMLDGKLGRLDPKEQKAVDNLTRLIVNQILREPVLRIKEFAVEDKSDLYVASLCHLFDLEGDLLPGNGIKTEDEKKSNSIKNTGEGLK